MKDESNKTPQAPGAKEEGATWDANRLSRLVAGLNAMSAMADGRPVYKLPFKLAYALGRNLNRAEVCLGPVNKLKSEIQNRLTSEIGKPPGAKASDEAKAKHEEKARELTEAANKELGEAYQTETDFEPYALPAHWTTEQMEQIQEAGLTPDCFKFLDMLGFSDTVKDA